MTTKKAPAKLRARKDKKRPKPEIIGCTVYLTVDELARVIKKMPIGEKRSNFMAFHILKSLGIKREAYINPLRED